VVVLDREKGRLEEEEEGGREGGAAAKGVVKADWTHACERGSEGGREG